MEMMNKRRATEFAVVAYLTIVAAACGGEATATRVEANSASSSSRSTATSDVALADRSRPSSSLGHAPNAPKVPGSHNARAPGGAPVDLTAENVEIERLEKTLKGKRTSDRERELARAYAVRAARLTEVQQYRAALGDWRRSARLDPSNEEAQNMIATITNIMQSMNRPVPAPGEEPTPLPLGK